MLIKSFVKNCFGYLVCLNSFNYNYNARRNSPRKKSSELPKLTHREAQPRSPRSLRFESTLLPSRPRTELYAPSIRRAFVTTHILTLQLASLLTQLLASCCNRAQNKSGLVYFACYASGSLLSLRGVRAGTEGRETWRQEAERDIPY